MPSIEKSFGNAAQLVDVLTRIDRPGAGFERKLSSKGWGIHGIPEVGKRQHEASSANKRYKPWPKSVGEGNRTIELSCQGAWQKASRSVDRVEPRRSEHHLATDPKAAHAGFSSEQKASASPGTNRKSIWN